MVDGGWLALSEVEVSRSVDSGLMSERFNEPKFTQIPIHHPPSTIHHSPIKQLLLLRDRSNQLLPTSTRYNRRW